MSNQSYIQVTFPIIGYHQWPDAPDLRAYLRNSHRHRFIITTAIEVFEEDREIEFHDFLAFCQQSIPHRETHIESEPINFGAMSCEAIARGLAEKVNLKYNHSGIPGEKRDISIAVSEDGEASAMFTMKF